MVSTKYIYIYIKNILKVRTTNLFSRNYPQCVFLRREGWQIPIIEQLTLSNNEL